MKRKFRVVTKQGDVNPYSATIKSGIDKDVIKLIYEGYSVVVSDGVKLKDHHDGVIITLPNGEKIDLNYSDADDLHTILQIWVDKINSRVPKTISIEELV